MSLSAAFLYFYWWRMEWEDWEEGDPQQLTLYSDGSKVHTTRRYNRWPVSIHLSVFLPTLHLEEGRARDLLSVSVCVYMFKCVCVCVLEGKRMHMCMKGTAEAAVSPKGGIYLRRASSHDLAWSLPFILPRGLSICVCVCGGGCVGGFALSVVGFTPPVATGIHSPSWLITLIWLTAPSSSQPRSGPPPRSKYLPENLICREMTGGISSGRAVPAAIYSRLSHPLPPRPPPARCLSTARRIYADSARERQLDGLSQRRSNRKCHSICIFCVKTNKKKIWLLKYGHSNVFFLLQTLQNPVSQNGAWTAWQDGSE